MIDFHEIMELPARTSAVNASDVPYFVGGRLTHAGGIC